MKGGGFTPPPHISQLVLLSGLEKVQALQDQREEEEEEEEGEEEEKMEGERQIWQCDFWVGGLRKVHLEHSHVEDAMRRKREILLLLLVEKEEEEREKEEEDDRRKKTERFCRRKEAI